MTKCDRYLHIRKYDQFGELAKRGGVSFGWVKDYDSNTVLIAKATCSKQDDFRRKDAHILIGERLGFFNNVDSFYVSFETLREYLFKIVNETLDVTGVVEFILFEDKIEVAAKDALTSVIMNITLKDISNITIERYIADMLL